MTANFGAWVILAFWAVIIIALWLVPRLRRRSR